VDMVKNGENQLDGTWNKQRIFEMIREKSMDVHN